MKNKIRFSPFILSSLITVAQPAHAVAYQIPQLTTVVENVTDTITWVIVSVLVLFIIAIGVQFMLASENPQERGRLKSRLLWMLIGIFIILSAKPLSIWLQSLVK